MDMCYGAAPTCGVRHPKSVCKSHEGTCGEYDNSAGRFWCYKPGGILEWDWCGLCGLPADFQNTYYEGPKYEFGKFLPMA